MALRLHAWDELLRRGSLLTVASPPRAQSSRAFLRTASRPLSLKTRHSSLVESIRRLIDVAFEAGAVDFVVTSYRASPDLLGALLRDSQTAERAGYIVARASDHEVASSIGMDALAALDPVSTLSAREREVYDLVCMDSRMRRLRDGSSFRIPRSRSTYITSSTSSGFDHGQRWY